MGANGIESGKETHMMDELRNEIWDYLFKSEHPRHLDDIAVEVGRDRDTVGAAVHHEWFMVSNNEVAIAYASNSRN
jgi:hypothetical protein